MSGVVPQVAAMVGPGAAGTAYIPGLADFVPMVKDIGSMALGGPPLVKAVTGEDIAEQELGGSKIHTDEERRRRRRGRERRGVHRAREEVPLVLPVDCDEAPPRLPVHRSRSIAARSRCSISCPRIHAQAVRHVQAHPRDRRSRRDPRHQAAVRRARIITCLARIGGRAGRHRRQPAEPPGRHPRRTTRPTRPRTSSRSATRSTCRSSSCRTCPASWSARRSSTRASSATAPRCCT